MFDQDYSVLMSVYHKDNPVFLSSALESIFQQTRPTNDLVLMLDGPLTEALYSVVNSFVQKYPAIINVHQIKENQGLGNALREGLFLCKNELVARMDADDISLPQRMEIQIPYLLENDLDVVGGQIEEFSSEGSAGRIHSYPIQPEEIKQFAKKRCPLGHPSVLFKKSSILDSGNYSSKMVNQQDYELWIRVIACGFLLGNVPQVVLKMRVDEDLYKNRRRGWKYFQRSRTIQKSLLSHKLISPLRYVCQVFARFVVAVLLPNRMRIFVYNHFLRKKK